MGYMSSLSFHDYGTLFLRCYAGLCSDFANIIHQEDPFGQIILANLIVYFLEVMVSVYWKFP